MTNKFYSVLFSGVIGCLLLAACASFGDSNAKTTQKNDQEFQQRLDAPVEGAVSFHTILEQSTNPEKELTVYSFYGETILIEKLPWLTSSEIQDIIPVERPLKVRGIYDLKLQLSDKGRKQWDAMVKNDSTDSEGYAVLVDGVFYVAIHPRRFYKESGREIMLDGPFDQVVATKLNKNAPFNYVKLKKAANEHQKNAKNTEKQPKQR